ncbi:uncharacterized protein ACR2FA_010443 [Aphomia sociella]
MEQLCTACLCTGRKLYLIGQTGSYHLYTQILNEISIYNMSQMCVRVCWECRAWLQRLQRFKEQVKRSYSLLMHVHENTPETVARPSNLQIQHVMNFSYPTSTVKTEDDKNKLIINDLDLNGDPDEYFKMETNQEYNVDLDATVKIESEHCEPETFVNDLSVEFDEVKRNKTSKEKVKKKLKEKKIVKKKIKAKKKRKLAIDSKKNEEIENSLRLDSDGISDREDFIDNNEILEDDAANVLDVKIEEYKCKECDLTFELESALRSHRDSFHKKTDRIKKDKIAKVTNRDEKPQCVECGKIFSSKKTYTYHLNVLHKGQNRYPCPRCGKVYQWKSNLGRHMRSHKARDSGELHCATCDKRFASVATYRQHLRVSRRHVAEAEFSFECDECGKKFVNKTRLRDHIDWDHLKKVKFRCQMCNKAFKCHTSLYVHVKSVHRERGRDNLCHVCGKAYQNAAKLKYHIVAMHTSETPYRCVLCSAAFGWYSSLYRHVREVHYKMKMQPKRIKRMKKGNELPSPPQLGMLVLQPGPP